MCYFQTCSLNINERLPHVSAARAHVRVAQRETHSQCHLALLLLRLLLTKLNITKQSLVAMYLACVDTTAHVSDRREKDCRTVTD